ncbi:hypothetical protein KIW84_013323 [Lathyrus oleraceus]|uniref:Glutathione synthase substrate-binding domain-containing protein n=1 Tax=Pisum sativum TaxID=3888 RepID=A0A9D5BJS4_PEA|nr:hypothetical protein KIW84_013323 [Pisum sativum]
MPTRIFAAYRNKIGVKTCQYDAFEIGFITTNDFTDVDILEATYPAVAKRLHGDWVSDPAIPVITGFLRKARKPCAVTTLGRGGSELISTTIGKALGLLEIQARFHQSILKKKPKSEGEILPDGTLNINGLAVAVIYFKVGYAPADYPSESEWKAMLLMERSSAIKCPSISPHFGWHQEDSTRTRKARRS